MFDLWKVFIICVRLVTVSVFLSICWVCITKTQLEEVGTTLQQNDVDYFDFPSVTLCTNIKSDKEKNITKMYQSFVQHNFVKYILHSNVSEHKYHIFSNQSLNQDEINSLLGNAKISHSLTAYLGRLVYGCIDYTPTTKYPIGVFSSAQILVDLSNSTMMVLGSANSGLLVKSMTNTYGRRNLFIGRSQCLIQNCSEYRTIGIAMEQKILTPQNKKSNFVLWGKDVPKRHKPCNDDTTTKELSDCIEKYLSGLTGCKFPWLDQPDSNLSLCQTEEDYDSFTKHVSSIADSGETAIYAKTRCVAPCTLNVYEPKKHLIDSMSESSVTRDIDALKVELAKQKEPTIVKLFKASGHVDTIESYYIYGMSNVMADFGSYLGLLLGASFISVFEAICHWIRNKLN